MTTVHNTINVADIPTAFLLREATPQKISKQLEETILSLTKRLRHLLPIEEAEQKKLLKQLQPIKRELADSVANRISLSFLKTRRLQEQFKIGSHEFCCNVPKFALFTLDSPSRSFTVDIECNTYWRGRNDNYDDHVGLLVSTPGTLADLFGLWDGMPQPTYDRGTFCDNRQSSHWWEYKLSTISKYRTDETVAREASCLFNILVYARSKNLEITHQTFTVSTAFAGALPDDIRAQIPIWQQLYDEVLICREATDWTVNEIQFPRKANRASLVFGRIDNDYWLLAKFHTTTAKR